MDGELFLARVKQGRACMLPNVNGWLVARHPDTAGYPQVVEGAVYYLGKGLVGNAGG
jgi:hypothetical protein